MSTIRVIGREDIQKVFTVTAALRAVESAYAGKSAGTGRVWPMVFHEFDPGHADLDIKSGDLESAGVYGLKVVSWYDSNAEKALPALFGTSLLFDLATGEPKALLNAGPITALRTGAAAAVGAKYLARKDAKTLTIVGCGELCPYLAAAALAAIPSLKTVYLTNPHRPEKGRRAARRRDSGNGRAAQGVRSCPYRRDQRRGRCSIRRRRKRHRFHRHLRQGAGRKERLGQARYACKLYRCRPARQAGRSNRRCSPAPPSTATIRCSASLSANASCRTKRASSPLSPGSSARSFSAKRPDGRAMRRSPFSTPPASPCRTSPPPLSFSKPAKSRTRHGLRNINQKTLAPDASSGARVFCNCNYSTRPSIPET